MADKEKQMNNKLKETGDRKKAKEELTNMQLSEAAQAMLEQK